MTHAIILYLSAVAQLASPSYAVRERADAALRRRGVWALPAAYAGTWAKDPEARVRCVRIVNDRYFVRHAGRVLVASWLVDGPGEPWCWFADGNYAYYGTMLDDDDALWGEVTALIRRRGDDSVLYRRGWQRECGRLYEVCRFRQDYRERPKLLLVRVMRVGVKWYDRYTTKGCEFDGE